MIEIYIIIGKIVVIMFLLYLFFIVSLISACIISEIIDEILNRG